MRQEPLAPPKLATSANASPGEGKAHQHELGPDHVNDHGHVHDDEPEHDHGHGHGAAHDAAHGHDHSHDHAGHHHHGRGAPIRRLSIALALTVSFMFVEVAAGLYTHSLALLSDAGHMLTDAGALALAVAAQHIASRPRTRGKTFGFHRAETLAALANGVVLGVGAVWVVAEAIRRWSAPPDIRAGGMLAVAITGLGVNLVSAWVLAGGSEASNSNVRAALAHVISDAAGSVAAILAAVLVSSFGLTRADPAASIAISLLILWGAWRVIVQSVDVLMEGTPAGVSLQLIESTVRDVPGVSEVHDLHVWCISEGFTVATLHVVLDGKRHGTDVARDVSRCIEQEHGISHVTVQPEAPTYRQSLFPIASLLRGNRPR